MLIVVISLASPARAQDPFAARAAIVSAEDRRAPTARDLAVIRGGLRRSDPQTAEIAVRALGRLERPALVPDIVPLLRNADPGVRAEAANAIAQAVDPLGSTASNAGPRGRRVAPDGLASAIAPLVSRLKVEEDSTVRAALCESLGRLPFAAAGQIEDAERELLASLDRDGSIDGRLGVAGGFDALARRVRALARAARGEADIGGAARTFRPAEAEIPAGPSLSEAALTALKTLASLKPGEAVAAARVRRLSLDALTTVGASDAETLRAASADPDAQVRRLAMKAAGGGEVDAVRRSVLAAGMRDEAPIVRYEALRALGAMPEDGGCAAALDAAADRDPHVALLALDTLGACGWSSVALDRLDAAVHDLSEAGSPRGWHEPAHALVALSRVAPARAAAALPQLSGSTIPWLRVYAARAAANLKDRASLERLARDGDDNVREAAVAGLVQLAGHAADRVYVTELDRDDHQLLRTAALALEGTPRPQDAIPSLRAALQRLAAEGHDNSRDARAALAATLRSLGVAAPAPTPVAELRRGSEVTADDLRRLQGARARVTIRGVGSFDLVLLAEEAPESVVRFADLASRGYYNGLTFHRVVPNFVVQGGSPHGNEYAGDTMYMRDEVGLWPHVRGAAGISTRGRDTGDAQIFVDLVDNPRLDHEYTVFAQVLNGMDVVDRILEGDVIDRIEIIAGGS